MTSGPSAPARIFTRRQASLSAGIALAVALAVVVAVLILPNLLSGGSGRSPGRTPGLATAVNMTAHFVSTGFSADLITILGCPSSLSSPGADWTCHFYIIDDMSGWGDSGCSPGIIIASITPSSGIELKSIDPSPHYSLCPGTSTPFVLIVQTPTTSSPAVDFRVTVDAVD